MINRIKHTVTIPGVGVVHDYRPQKQGWGWNGLSWEVAKDQKSAVMMGIGYGLKAGEHIALHLAGEDLGFKIKEIKYESNPPDMFTATVYLVGEFEEGELPV